MGPYSRLIPTVSLSMGLWACADELPPPAPAHATDSGLGGGAGSTGGSSGSGGGAGCACSPNHATGSCTSGSCVVTSCNPGYGNCDDRDDNGCEVRLDVDGNCGECGRECLGAACTAGVCEGIVLLSALAAPWGVAVDATSIYFSDSVDGYIDRASKVDGAGRISLASGYPWTWFLVMDGGYVYFTTRKGHTVERVLADGSAPAETVLSPGVKTGGLAIDSGFIYFTQSDDTGFVWRAPKKVGATSVKLTTAQVLPLGLTVDGSNVYWSGGDKLADGQVRRIAKTASPNTSAGQQVATGQGAVFSVISDSKMVFWSSADTGLGRISRYNIATTKIDTLAVTEEPAAYAAVDEKNIYWAASDDSAGYVYRLAKNHDASKNPAPPVKLYSGAGAKPRYLAVDEVAVYFTDHGTGRILKVAK